LDDTTGAAAPVTGSTGDKTVTTATGESDNFLNVHGNYTQVFGNGNEFTGLNQFDVAGNMTIDHANGGSFVFLGVDKANLGTEFNRVGGNLIVDNVNPSGKAANGFDVNALEETNVGDSLRANMGLAGFPVGELFLIDFAQIEPAARTVAERASPSRIAISPKQAPTPSVEIGVMQENTALPSTRTVHAPHWPSPQPNFAPFSARSLRST
jgi:hypothetical protein